MTKQEVITRFCQLSNKVRSGVFLDKKTAGCFCEYNNFGEPFIFQDDILNFIERAVEAEMKKVVDARKKNDEVRDRLSEYYKTGI